MLVEITHDSGKVGDSRSFLKSPSCILVEMDETGDVGDSRSFLKPPPYRLEGGW
jgi:hypothetical protein